MSLRRSLSHTIRAHSPFSTRSTSSSASHKQRKQWRQESDEIGRKMDQQGWACTAEAEDIDVVGTEETGHTQSETAVEHDHPSVDLNDFEIVAGPPVPVRAGSVEEEGRREIARSPSPISLPPTSEPAHPPISHPQRIKPSFILSPRPFIPGITAPTHPNRRSYREPTPTASLSRKGSTRSRTRRHSSLTTKRMTPRRIDSRRSRLSWPTRALSLVRRRRILSESKADLLGESGTVRLGFDSAILLWGESVDEFGRIAHAETKPEDVPLPDSPIASSLNLPDEEDEDEHLPRAAKHQPTDSPSSSSPSSSTSSLTHIPTPHPYPYPYRAHQNNINLPTTILKTGRKFRPYYTRPVSSHHDELQWDFNPVASTYLFLHTVIVFAEPVLPDLNFLEGVSVPGVREVGMGRAI